MTDAALEKVSELTINAVRDMHSEMKNQFTLTRALLDSKDVFGVTQDVSAKRLAFLIPAVELVHKFKPLENEIVVIIICPTRKLAVETHSVAKKVMKNHSYTLKLVIGGAAQTLEEKNIKANILVATPDWLLYHLLHNKGLNSEMVKGLVIDDVDRILEADFVMETEEINELLPKEGRAWTALFSATFTEKVRDYASMWFQETPACTDLDGGTMRVTKEELQLSQVTNDELQLWHATKEELQLYHHYFVQAYLRFPLFYCFLKKNLSKKIIVIFSSRESVKFHSELLRCFKIDCLESHGDRNKSTLVFLEFMNVEKGILLCTDDDAHALAIPVVVDWFVQYDPPRNPWEFMGRVALCCKVQRGSSIIFLDPEEKRFHQFMADQNMPAVRYDVGADKNELDGVYCRQLEFVGGRYHLLYKISEEAFASYIEECESLYRRDLRKHAEEAFKSYIQACESHTDTKLFDVFKLHHEVVAEWFGLPFIPED